MRNKGLPDVKAFRISGLIAIKIFLSRSFLRLKFFKRDRFRDRKFSIDPCSKIFKQGLAAKS